MRKQELNKIIEDITNKVTISPHWSVDRDNQEYKYWCDWYGREYYGDSSSEICVDIISDYGLDKQPRIGKTSIVLRPRRNR